MRAPSGVALEVLALEPEQPHPVSADDRPEILIRPELNAMTDDALAALAARPALAVYVRAGMLVTVAWDGSSPERWLRRPPGAPRIVQLDHARMRGLMDSAARWMKPGGHRKDVRAPAMPPGDIAAQVLARHEWPLPYLQAVVETPVIRPDGSVLNRSGYDVESELLYQPVPGQQGWPGVPARPTDSDVRAAVDALAEPVAQFPFKAGTDLSAYVAAVLTALAREMIPGPIPAFVVRAPTPGTGKTLLVVVVALTGTGRAPAVMAMTYDGEELRKRITSIALSGTPLVLVDNASGALGSDALAGALTATEWEDRILGVSQMVRLPLRAIWFVTGNNISFRKTLARRVVPIDLDAGVETPEDRTGVRRLVREYGGVGSVVVDEVALGGGVLNELRERLPRVRYWLERGAERSVRAVGFKSSHRAGQHRRFQNRRAECFHYLATRFERDTIAFHPDVDADLLCALREELLAHAIVYGGDDRLGIVAKDEVRKVLGRSPDLADAVVMAFSRDVPQGGRQFLLGR